MYQQLSCVTVDADAANRQELGIFLSRFGVSTTGQFANSDNLTHLLARSDAPQLVIVNLDPAPHENLKRIAELPRKFPSVSFFLMSQTMDATLLMEAMHLGVREFIPVPVDEARFEAAIERVAAQHGMGKKAKLIHVVPTIGGCGSTTVACNVAASLAQSSKAALLDMDLICGGVASYFDTRPRYTIADVMDSSDRVDQQMLDNALAVHPGCNLSILARPELPEDTQRVHPAGFNRLVGVLGRMFDYVVVDSIMSIDPIYAAAIEAADMNVIVMQLNVPSAKNAERFVGALRRMGVETSKLRVVVNRYVKKGWDIEPEEVERALGLKISWMIPNDYKNAIAAVNFGEPVVLRAPKADMSISLMGLAGTFNGKVDPDVRQAA
jgi:pilus assembly protein CpaE